MYSRTKLFFVFTSPTHPRHYAENGLRLLEEGDGVEGSSGFPGSVCLHPLHGPPPPLSPSPLLAQRHRVCGAPGNRNGKSPKLLPITTTVLPLNLHGWDARLPPPPVSFGDLFSRAVGFKCTSNISPLCVGKESFVMVLDSDAFSL